MQYANKSVMLSMPKINWCQYDSKIVHFLIYLSFFLLNFLYQVMQSLRFALQPAVVDISVTWDLPKGISATALSPPIQTIFQGQRILAYYQLTGQVEAWNLLQPNIFKQLYKMCLIK